MKQLTRSEMMTTKEGLDLIAEEEKIYHESMMTNNEVDGNDVNANSIDDSEESGLKSRISEKLAEIRKRNGYEDYQPSNLFDNVRISNQELEEKTR